MHLHILATLLSLASLSHALPNSKRDDSSASAGTGPDADGKYTIAAEGIRAQFIPYGASITNLFIEGKDGKERDVVLGYDNATAYETDVSHPHLGGVPGRYANRIKNSSFTIDGQQYHVLPNENGGLDTLHGGPKGWDWRNFTVVSHTASAITFRIDDPAGEQGFPGAVTSLIEYSVTPRAWHFRMTATATQKTPLMLSSHVYWNLDGYQNPNTNTVLNHTLALPFSGQRVGVDGILIPTGDILPNAPGSVNDFWSQKGGKQIGASFGDPELVGNCGTGCKGYDNCYIVNRAQYAPGYFEDAEGWWRKDPVATLSSAWSGIKLDVFTDQDAFQVYSCGGQNGTQPIKKTQGFFSSPETPATSFPRVTPQYGCVVLEVQDWIDGINNPAWQRLNKQITGTDSPAYSLEATYRFSLVGEEDEEGNGGGY